MKTNFSEVKPNYARIRGRIGEYHLPYLYTVFFPSPRDAMKVEGVLPF